MVSVVQVRVFDKYGSLLRQESWQVPENAEKPSDMKYAEGFENVPSKGHVLVSSDNPWGESTMIFKD